MTRKILNATNPDKKKNGRMVNRSTMPSNDIRNLKIAFLRETSGKRRSAVHILRTYSMQKIIIVIKEMASRIGK